MAMASSSSTITGMPMTQFPTWMERICKEVEFVWSLPEIQEIVVVNEAGDLEEVDVMEGVGIHPVPKQTTGL